MTKISEAGLRTLDVGIDLDGVGYCFLSSLRHYLVLHDGYNPDRLADATRWEFYEDWGFTLEQFLAQCHAGVDAGVVFRHGNPIHDYVQMATALRAAGHRVHIVTDRSFGTGDASQVATRDWLAEHQVPYDTLTFSADKTCVPTEVFIEDKLANYDALDAAGVRVFLLNRAYNQVPGDGRRRVDTLEQFVQQVALAAQPEDLAATA